VLTLTRCYVRIVKIVEMLCNNKKMCIIFTKPSRYKFADMVIYSTNVMNLILQILDYFITNADQTEAYFVIQGKSPRNTKVMMSNEKNFLSDLNIHVPKLISVPLQNK
jgi:hypothetical protein